MPSVNLEMAGNMEKIEKLESTCSKLILLAFDIYPMIFTEKDGSLLIMYSKCLAHLNPSKPTYIIIHYVCMQQGDIVPCKWMLGSLKKSYSCMIPRKNSSCIYTCLSHNSLISQPNLNQCFSNELIF